MVGKHTAHLLTHTMCKVIISMKEIREKIVWETYVPSLLKQNADNILNLWLRFNETTLSDIIETVMVIHK